MKNLFISTLILQSRYQSPKLFLYHQWRGIAKVRLKWVKNRSLDHIIDTETDLKAACLLKDAIKRSPTGFITVKSIADWQKLLGLTIPVIRFIRRYPTLFHEFPHSRYANLRCFRLTDTALFLDQKESSIHQVHENDTVERLCRVLMMMKTRAVPLQSLRPLEWDLGLPCDFERSLVPRYPDHFRLVKASNGDWCLRLMEWREEFAVSALQRSNQSSELGDAYRQFKRGHTTLAFPMNFPRGYGAQKKVKAWMEEFQKLPYISPYESCRQIDPNSDLMEKRVVGVLHELLSLTLHKKTKRNYLRSLREEMNLPHKFTRIFTRYPGIFYLSLKCKTTTVSLKEGYQRGKLVNPHPLTCLRERFYHVMKTGLLYRGKGAALLEKEGILLNNTAEVVEDGLDIESDEAGDDECSEDENSQAEESDSD
ncbi:protein WHAT'S THIS FACTOR 9, mitochondrial [Benincasa hispida]|uniref:protein WHAT'S THIS FACTOR 9, mitochondrial n=1 Tax=Benincasa hispida TaxID=102211 RepID=UPI0018FF9B7E|nr:protein WHAT'S THIS FACTOR 9, mitochondrial [Benincasa hispida]